MTTTVRPRLAVWKFASCDGCQLALLDCEDELLAIADQIEVGQILAHRDEQAAAGPPPPLPPLG